MTTDGAAAPSLSPGAAASPGPGTASPAEPVVLDGSSLTLERLVRVARAGARVELAPEALARIAACRAMLEEKIADHEVMYGINTGSASSRRSP
jgi:hypothetical protein